MLRCAWQYWGMTKTYWKHYTARQRLHCTLCRFDGENVGRADMGNSPDGTNAPSLILMPTPECNPIKHGAAFTAKQRAAFKRHVRELHPSFYDRIAWSRSV